MKPKIDKLEFRYLLILKKKSSYSIMLKKRNIEKRNETN